ncbi:MAG: Ig-like domain-containing protein [Methanoregula sp.]
MRAHLILISIAFLLLLAGAGNAAVIPDQNSTISSNTANNWVVVAHQSIITVDAYNSTALNPVVGATVTFALNSTLLGSLTPSSGISDASGMAESTFSAGTKTGAVNITATITYNNITVTKVLTENIDHDVAQNAAFDFMNEVTVGSETPFNISLTDKYGNPIDNRNPADLHSVALWISASSDNMAAFNISGTHLQYINQSLDANGNISVSVITDTKPGENEILLYPFGNVGYPWGVPQFIYGLNDGQPYSVTESITPSNLIEPADNGPDHIFSVTTTLYDKYGNPTEDQEVQVQSNYAGDPIVNMSSNPFGQVFYTYGPHSASGYVILTATCPSNTSVSTSETVQFYSTAPVNMAFTATPQVMASLDANPSQIALLQAKVMDEMGNPVANQTVTFSLGTPTYTYSNCSLSGPTLLNTTATTNINGTATVVFIPGKFDTNQANISYDPTDTGSVTATATWNGINQPIKMSWKNYPYLSEQTTVIPPNVNVGGNFTVMINLTADGWNLTGTPADVVIVSDLAGGIGGTGRLANTQKAEVGFIKNATDDTYISLASFGDSPSPSGSYYASSDTRTLYAEQKAAYPAILKPFNPYGLVNDSDMVDPAHWNSITSGNDYCFNGVACINATNPMSYQYLNPWSDASVDAPLENAGPTFGNQPALSNTVNQYTANGGTDYAAGINAALQVLVGSPGHPAQGNPTHNQTVIIMGDGINMMAPIAPGSLESYWPSDWNPRNGTGTSEGPQLWWFDESDVGKAAAVDAATRAKNQGITIYGIGFPDADNSGHNNISDMSFFDSLASAPSTVYFAPDPTTMTGIFQQIEGQIQNTAGVNTTMTLNLQSVAITYDNVTNVSSDALSYVYNPASSTQITDQNGYTSIINQTDEWNQNKTLIFNIGKMTVGQTWSTSFELQLLQPGSANIPGNMSTICFNTGQCMIPNSGTVTGSENYSNTGFNMPVIGITDLQAQSSTVTTVVPLQWNITYPGSEYATEDLYYNSVSNPTWKFIAERPVDGPVFNYTQAYSWDVSSLPAGDYSVEVIAYAHDADSGKEIIPTSIVLGQSAKAFIRLQ